MRVTLKMNPSDEVRERLEELARFRGESLVEVMHSVLSTGLFLEEGMLVDIKPEQTVAKLTGRKERRGRIPPRVPAESREISRRAAKGG